MATRGYLGGLARSAGDVITLLEAAGKDIVLVETVGVGQDEIEVVHLAELILVVLTPDAGDDVQVFKAGIMEIADIFVLNKADSPDCDNMERRLKALLDMGTRGRPIPPIVKTTASIGEGIENLWDVIERYGDSMSARDREQRQRRRITWMLKSVLHDIIAEKVAAALPESQIEAMANRIFRHEVDPYTLAESIIQDMKDE
jgi:LAO/AO transport system kinase